MSNEVVEVNTNAEIKTLFTGFTVGGVSVPVSFLVYQGHGEPYVVYTQYDQDNSYSTEDEIAGYVTYYDFDVYSKGNILPIIKAVKQKFKGTPWIWQPSRDSQILYDTDTGYFHKTICFARPVQEVETPEPEEQTENQIIGGLTNEQDN